MLQRFPEPLDENLYALETEIQETAEKASKLAAHPAPEALLTAHEASREGIHRAMKILHRVLIGPQLPDPLENQGRITQIQNIMDVSIHAGYIIMNDHKIHSTAWLRKPSDQRATNARLAVAKGAVTAFETALRLMRNAPLTNVPETSKALSEASEIAVNVANQFHITATKAASKIC